MALTSGSSGPRCEQVSENLSARVTKRRFIDQEGQPLSWRSALAAWKSPDFAIYFSTCLAESPWPAFFWETPALAAGDLDMPFECVTIAAPMLATVRAEVTPFATQLARLEAGRQVGSFPNLGGDAQLIVPRNMHTNAVYAHLGVFVRTAPPIQITELWSVVASTVEANVKAERRIWISTAGQGVSWLHVRIDTRPKYYSYDPYRN
jgi:hypothetical protein